MESDLTELSKALLEAKSNIEKHHIAVSEQEQKVSCLVLELESTKHAMELANSTNSTEKVNEPDLSPLTDPSSPPP